MSLPWLRSKGCRRRAKLDAAAVVARIEPALFARSAATAKGALALLTDAAESAPQLRSETARLAAIGLEHAGSDVQAVALRFAADRPGNATELLAPLARPLKRFREYGYDGSDALTPRGAVQLVMCAFIDGTPCAANVHENDPRAVIALRTVAMAHAICARTPCLQLSAPTHRCFWIDPRVLVERSKEAAKDGMALLGVADQILALLRLAPDRRPEALTAARGIDGEWGAALRYALGGDAGPGKTHALWVAAARARAPFDEDRTVAKLVGRGTRGADLPPRLAPRILYRSYGTSRMFAEVAIAADDADTEACAFGMDAYRWWDVVEDAPRNAAPEHCLPSVDLATWGVAKRTAVL